jgi:hypothetical protein
MEWNWQKNRQAQKAFARTEQIIAVLQSARMWDTYLDGPDGEIPLLTEDQLEALLCLGAEATEDLYTLLEAILPDPDAWWHAQTSKASRAFAERRNAPAVNPPSEQSEAV